MTDEKMIIVYTGNKKGLHLTLPDLSEEILIAKDDPTGVSYDDGVFLTTTFPASFREYKASKLDEFLSQREAQKELEDNLAAEEQEVAEAVKENESLSQQDGEVSLEDMDFDVKDEKYLCPVCEKSYSVNNGRGKYYVAKHMKEDHPEEYSQYVEQINASKE